MGKPTTLELGASGRDWKKRLRIVKRQARVHGRRPPCNSDSMAVAVDRFWVVRAADWKR